MLAACSLGGAGHFNPLLAFLAAASAKGYEVLVVGPESMDGTVRDAGHAFQGGGEPAEDEIAPIREQLAILPQGEAAVLAGRELFGRMATTAMLPAMGEVVRSWQPDVVVRDPCEYASSVIADAVGIPMAQVAISLADVEWGALKVARPALEAHRAGLTDAIAKTPYLTRFPSSLDPSPFPATLRFRAASSRQPVQPLPDWWRGSDAPLVYITFGTVLGYMSFAPQVYRAAIGAVEELDVRVLVTTGHRLDVSTLGHLPANVRVEPWVEQERVTGQAAVVVCHGGSGTVLGALEAGVPLVTVPVFADQFENGRRVAETEAGRHIVVGTTDESRHRQPIGADDSVRIAEAIDAVLGDDRFHAGARRVAAEMAAASPIADVLDDLVARGTMGAS